jgi:hypothetical protein
MALQPKCGKGLSEKIPSLYLYLEQSSLFVVDLADDIWAVGLLIEFEIVPAPEIVHTVFYFWAIYRAENFPLKDEQSDFFPFCQHSRFTALQQDRVDQGLVTK